VPDDVERQEAPVGLALGLLTRLLSPAHEQRVAVGERAAVRELAHPVVRKQRVRDRVRARGQLIGDKALEPPQRELERFAVEPAGETPERRQVRVAQRPERACEQVEGEPDLLALSGELRAPEALLVLPPVVSVAVEPGGRLESSKAAEMSGASRSASSRR
jgi:hypothetical protein